MIDISVIIPMYNAEKTILSAIESVLKQKCKYNIEIIIVNDGSTDNSEKIINEFIKKNLNKNIKLFTKNNGGVSSARNIGIKNACGEFIAFLDADDKWLDGKIEKQMNIFNRYKDAALIGTTYNGIIYKKFKNIQKITLNQLIFKNYFQPSTVIIRRNIIKNIGFFNEEQRYAEEGNYFIRIAYKYNCYLLNESLLNFGNGKRGFGESGLSSNIKEMEKGELNNIRFAYKNRYIKLYTYLIAIIFSLLKYIRRLLLSSFYKILKGKNIYE